MTTETKAEFARRHGVDRATVGRWAERGRLAMTADGRVNVEESEHRLSQRPATYRGGKAKGPAAVETMRQAAHEQDPPSQTNPAEIAVSALSVVVRKIGARAARRAVEFGASLQTAYALDTALCLDAGELGERFLASIGAPLAPSWSLVEVADTNDGGIVPADWPALAKAAGEPLDLPALEDWFYALPNFDPPKDASHG